MDNLYKKKINKDVYILVHTYTVWEKIVRLIL